MAMHTVSDGLTRGNLLTGSDTVEVSYLDRAEIY